MHFFFDSKFHSDLITGLSSLKQSSFRASHSLVSHGLSWRHCFPCSRNIQFWRRSLASPHYTWKNCATHTRVILFFFTFVRRTMFKFTCALCNRIFFPSVNANQHNHYITHVISTIILRHFPSCSPMRPSSHLITSLTT